MPNQSVQNQIGIGFSLDFIIQFLRIVIYQVDLTCERREHCIDCIYLLRKKISATGNKKKLKTIGKSTNRSFVFCMMANWFTYNGNGWRIGTFTRIANVLVFGCSIHTIARFNLYFLSIDCVPSTASFLLCCSVCLFVLRLFIWWSFLTFVCIILYNFLFGVVHYSVHCKLAITCSTLFCSWVNQTFSYYFERFCRNLYEILCYRAKKKTLTVYLASLLVTFTLLPTAFHCYLNFLLKNVNLIRLFYFVEFRYSFGSRISRKDEFW